MPFIIYLLGFLSSVAISFDKSTATEIIITLYHRPYTSSVKQVFKKQRKVYSKAHPDEKKSGDKRLEERREGCYVFSSTSLRAFMNATC